MSPHQLQSYRVQKLSGNPFIATIWYIEICDCENLALWSAIFLTYKILKLLFGAYMSWKVRKVYTRKLVDGQYCASLLLLAVPCCILALIFAYTLRLYPTPHYGIMGIIIIIYTYIVLGFLYGHKIINIFWCPRNMIRVRSKDDNSKCCSGVITACCAPIVACFTIICCCCPLSCCKVLWDALVHGPKKNRGSIVKKNEKLDYQIGDMPADKERQIIILQKEVEKREEELKRLRRNNRATLAAKETQTTGYFHTNGGLDVSDSSGCVNEGYMEEDNNNKRGAGRQNFNRFKVYHRKLDFSHVGSKVDSGLDNKHPNKRSGFPVSESDELRRGSDDSEILLLQKTLSDRDKELAQLKAYLGMDPSSSTEASSKIGSLASIGEEQDLHTFTDSEAPNRNVSSVAITIRSNDSDGDSKQTGSDISNDEIPSDVNEQTVELLRETKTAADQEVQMGILPDPQSAEQTVPDSSKDKTNEEEKKKAKTKTLSSAYGTGAYISHYNAKGSGGKFKKKVRQLNSFGIFAKKPDSNTSNVQNTSSDPVIDQTSHDSQMNVGNEVVEESKNAVDKDKSKISQNTPGHNGQKAKSNVKIFNAPTNWSHVKSRLFDPNTQNTLKTSPNMNRRKSKAGIDDDGVQKTGDSVQKTGDGVQKKGDGVQKTGDDVQKTGDDEKMRNAVKIFNSPSDYSQVKSRLFDSNASGSQTYLKANTRRKSKVGVDDDIDVKPGESAEAGEKRNGVKIFNSSTDYSHVKSRLFDVNANQNNSESSLKASPNIRGKPKVGIEDDGDINSDEKKRGKIFNATSNYSHIKSRLFDDGSSSRRSSQVNPQDIDGVNGQGKENQVSKNRPTVKIFNAPSDYSHVKSRLNDSSNKADNKFKSKVREITSFGALKSKSTNLSEEANTENKKESTNV